MKPVRAIILGYGIRGRAYASYAATHPDEFEIAGLADPVAEFPADAKYPTWKSWEAAIDAGVDADAVVISLPDRLHHASCLKALEKGYHVLLEKPIGCTWDECREIAEAQKRTRRLVLTGYVLRYAPFYKKLREVIASGAIGELTSVHHLAAISYGKAAHAYCRGNWSVEAKGTGMLVNKCTHDFDLIEWWTKGKRCTKISSFGSLMHWRPENRPAGAADRCKDCPEAVREKCPFDAYKVYYDRTDLRYHFADESDEAILKMIQERNRITHFYGTRGEIIADEHKIEILPFLGDSTTIIPQQHGHHGGGDREIMTEFVKLVRTASPDRYSGVLEAALESHRIAFLAEESRKSGRTIID